MKENGAQTTSPTYYKRRKKVKGNGKENWRGPDYLREQQADNNPVTFKKYWKVVPRS